VHGVAFWEDDMGGNFETCDTIKKLVGLLYFRDDFSVHSKIIVHLLESGEVVINGKLSGETRKFLHWDLGVNRLDLVFNGNGTFCCHFKRHKCHAVARCVNLLDEVKGTSFRTSGF
jgi:hypothetical protein